MISRLFNNLRTECLRNVQRDATILGAISLGARLLEKSTAKACDIVGSCGMAKLLEQIVVSVTD